MLVELAVRDLGVIAELRLVLGPGHDRRHRRDRRRQDDGGRRHRAAGRRPGRPAARADGRGGGLGRGPLRPGRHGPRHRRRPRRGGDRPGDPALGPQPGLRRRPPGHRRRARRPSAPCSSTSTASTPTSRCSHPAAQRDALDRFAGVDLAPLRAARVAVHDLARRAGRLGGDERARARELDLVRYQVDEIEAAAIGGARRGRAARGRGGRAGRRRPPTARRPPLAVAALSGDGDDAAVDGPRPRPTRSARPWRRWPGGGRSRRPRSGCGRSPPRWPTWRPSCARPARPSTRTPSGSRPCASAATCCASCGASTARRSPT